MNEYLRNRRYMRIYFTKNFNSFSVPYNFAIKFIRNIFCVIFTQNFGKDKRILGYKYMYVGLYYFLNILKFL